MCTFTYQIYENCQQLQQLLNLANQTTPKSVDNYTLRPLHTHFGQVHSISSPPYMVGGVVTHASFSRKISKTWHQHLLRKTNPFASIYSAYTTSVLHKTLWLFSCLQRWKAHSPFIESWYFNAMNWMSKKATSKRGFRHVKQNFG